MKTSCKISKFFIPLVMSLGIMWALVGCDEDNSIPTSDCIEGVIPNDTIYKRIYEECYTNSIWIEVINSDGLGENVEIFTPSPTGQANFPTQYNNVIEVPVPDQLLRSNQLDTLLGKKIYFRYRLANDGEISALRNAECSEVYETYDIPVLILTQLSFDGCPQTTDF